MEKGISRKDFLRTSATVTAGISALGLLGACVPSGKAGGTAAAGRAGAAPVGGDSTYGGALNPQVAYAGSTVKSTLLFTPLTIGGKTLKNRIVKSAAGSDSGKQGILPYYERLAKGGAAMLCLEAFNIFRLDPRQPGLPPGIFDNYDISTDKGIPEVKRIADALHKDGVVVIAQMFDMGFGTGMSTSKRYRDKYEMSFTNGHMQTTAEVRQEIAIFADAAERYSRAGIDGVEINASCNHYFATFLSRYMNNERHDEFDGSSIENRARVVTELIKEIRRRVGPDFIIQVLYSGVEEVVSDLGRNDLCTTVDEACEMAKLFEAAGASSLHIRSQVYGHHCAGFMPDVLHLQEHGGTAYGTVADYGSHFDRAVIGKYDGSFGLLEVAGRIKSKVSIPMGLVGSVDPRLAPDIVEKAIADKKIDFILMTRALIADFDLPNKLKEGRIQDVRPCTRCMTCFVAPLEMGTKPGCRVNAAFCRAGSDDMPEGYDPKPVEKALRVMVVGGGPAGLEAARILAERGHSVKLYERRKELGGMMNLVAAVKGGHEKILAHRQYLVGQLEKAKVPLVLGKEVDSAFIKSEAPDAVIIATGGKEAEVSLSGVDPKRLLTYERLYAYAGGDKALPLGEEVVIVGAQVQACELAIHALKRGKRVTILNQGPESEFYLNGATWPKYTGRDWIRAKGAKVHHEVVLVGASGDSIVFRTTAGIEKTLRFDSLVWAKPFVRNRDLYEAALGSCGEVYAIGDCYSPLNIANAISRGNLAARQVGNPRRKTGAKALPAGFYAATATGNGDVTVAIGVKDGRIYDATVDTSNDTSGIGQGLGPVFAAQIKAKGRIDAVSGATLTSQAVQTALDACKKQAGLK